MLRPPPAPLKPFLAAKASARERRGHADGENPGRSAGFRAPERRTAPQTGPDTPQAAFVDLWAKIPSSGPDSGQDRKIGRGSTRGNTRRAAGFLSPRRGSIPKPLATGGLRPRLNPDRPLGAKRESVSRRPGVLNQAENRRRGSPSRPSSLLLVAPGGSGTRPSPHRRWKTHSLLPFFRPRSDERPLGRVWTPPLRRSPRKSAFPVRRRQEALRGPQSCRGALAEVNLAAGRAGLCL